MLKFGLALQAVSVELANYSDSMVFERPIGSDHGVAPLEGHYLFVESVDSHVDTKYSSLRVWLSGPSRTCWSLLLLKPFMLCLSFGIAASWAGLK